MSAQVSGSSRSRRLTLIFILVALAVLVADQCLKVWIKTHFYFGEDMEILPFFHLRFIQNNGMAFGMEIGSKMLLTSFRILLVGFLTWYIYRLIKVNLVSTGYIVAISLITAGAFGNIIDCVLYGEIFNNPYPPEVATFVPFGTGYGTWFHGLVVDMLYFPLFEFTWPSWFPFIGGEHFSFFDPVFNIADSAITVGMFMIVLFYSKYLSRRYYALPEDKESDKSKD